MAITSLGSFSGANDTDKTKRIPAALNALNKALAGDLTQLTYMRQQSLGSATAVGKAAFVRALAIYDAQKPAPAPAPAAPPLVAVAPPPLKVTPPNPLPSPPVAITKDPIVPTVTTEGPGAAPVGFQTGGVLVDPVIPTVRVTGIRPRLVTPINVGSDGGVITGPPAPEYSGPTSAPVADPNYGYQAPAPTPVKADGTPATVAAPSSDSKTLLLLFAAVCLWAFIEGKRK